MTVQVRRNAVLCAGLGVTAAVLGIGWLQRAAGSGRFLDWLLCVLMTLIAVVQLAALTDARTPLVVADAEGARIRLGGEWLGLPWSTLEQVVVEQRDTPVRDGRLVLVPRNPGNVLEALGPSSRRAVAWQRRLHGAPLTVPLSIGTRFEDDLVDRLRDLAAGRAEIVVHRGRERVRLADDPAVPVREQARPPEAELTADPPPDPPVIPVTPVTPVRAARRVARAEVTREAVPREVGPPIAETVAEPTADEPVSPPTWQPTAGADVPAPVRVRRPVIGPQLAGARERAGLDVDQLSERTCVRPHVLEAIEVDDFAPCGGDFYARGHLRTLARYLGLDAAPLLAAYDEHYAHAPINARRVFEAELATGIGGGLRATGGGPRWSLIAAAVLSLLMIWGVARFFTTEPAPVAAPPGESAGLAAQHRPITSPLTDTSELGVKAVGGRTHVVVRDRRDRVLWRGVLHRGEEHSVAGVAPFTVRAGDGAAARVRLEDRWLGPVGESAGEPAQRRVG